MVILIFKTVAIIKSLYTLILAEKNKQTKKKKKQQQLNTIPFKFNTVG